VAEGPAGTGVGEGAEGVTGAGVVVCALYVEAPCGTPVVNTPATNVKVVAPALTTAVEVVQVTTSPAVPAVSTHLAVAPPVSVLSLVESTVLKYLDGKAKTMVPLTGTAVAVVKPKVTLPVFTVPGTLSPATINAMFTPEVSWPPRATVLPAEAS